MVSQLGKKLEVKKKTGKKKIKKTPRGGKFNSDKGEGEKSLRKYSKGVESYRGKGKLERGRDGKTGQKGVRKKSKCGRDCRLKKKKRRKNQKE